MNARRNGCFNRPEFRRVYPAQDGWFNDGTRENATRTPKLVAVPFRLAPDCQYTHSEAGRTDPGCVGCRWKTE